MEVAREGIFALKTPTEAGKARLVGCTPGSVAVRRNLVLFGVFIGLLEPSNVCWCLLMSPSAFLVVAHVSGLVVRFILPQCRCSFGSSIQNTGR